jgi:hypothetical protein
MDETVGELGSDVDGAAWSTPHPCAGGSLFDASASRLIPYMRGTSGGYAFDREVVIVMVGRRRRGGVTGHRPVLHDSDVCLGNRGGCAMRVHEALPILRAEGHFWWTTTVPAS